MSLLEASQLLGNFGEFFGAIAVVVTLAFLAIQVRHSKEATEENTRIMRASLSYQGAQTWGEANAQVIENLDLLGLATVAVSRVPRELSSEETNRLWLHNRHLLERWDGLYYLHKQGVLDEEFWDSRVEWMRWYLNKTWNKQWWERERFSSNYSSGFVEIMDSLIESSR